VEILAKGTTQSEAPPTEAPPIVSE
jgi:hypothetical protein